MVDYLAETPPAEATPVAPAVLLAEIAESAGMANS